MSSHQKPACTNILLLGLMFTAVSCAVSAVEINPDGGGQAVISPLWTTTGGHNTLMSVTSLENDSSYDPQVAAFRLFDRNGDTVFAASIYFQRPGDQWTLGIGSAGDGLSMLSSVEPTCVLVAGDDGPIPFGGQAAIAADFGYATVIGMGNIEGQAPRQLMDNGDCAGLAALWSGGQWKNDPAAGALQSSLFDVETMMVAVESGVIFDIPSTALTHFSDIPQHHPPSSDLPNLGSAHDAGTGENATTGRRCIEGNCEESTFSTPLAAMDFALSTPVLQGDYLIEPSMAARTEAIFTSPLGRLKRANGVTGLAAHPFVGVVYSNRDGRGVGGSFSGTNCPSAPPPGGCPWGSTIPQSVFALPVIVIQSETPSSSALRSQPSGIPLPDYEDPVFGVPLYLPGIYAWSGVERNVGRIRAVNDAIWYGGGADTAVIGVTLMQVSNGYLNDGEGNRVLASYGKAAAMHRVSGD